jgi:CheY-like chemotaxis protein
VAILIVEDNPVNAQLIALTLKANSYRIVLARNGREALAALEGKEPIDLIITDFSMPEMDGLELVAKVRAMPAFNNISILIASAHTDFETVTHAKNLGCNGFLSKPIEKQVLLKKVSQLVKDEPPVLRSKQYVMHKLGISSEEYDSLATPFAAELAATIPIVVLEQGDPHEPISANLAQLLKELAESATVLGADKFARVYERISKNPVLTRSHCPTLQHTLQELESALNAYLKSAPRPDVKN